MMREQRPSQEEREELRRQQHTDVFDEEMNSFIQELANEFLIEPELVKESLENLRPRMVGARKGSLRALELYSKRTLARNFNPRAAQNVERINRNVDWWEVTLENLENKGYEALETLDQLEQEIELLRNRLKDPTQKGSQTFHPPSHPPGVVPVDMPPELQVAQPDLGEHRKTLDETAKNIMNELLTKRNQGS